MKHLNPLRTLRLLTALSAATTPVYVPLFVGLTTTMVTSSTVLGQASEGGSLPPLLPSASAPAPAVAPIATPANSNESLTKARELLTKARTALAEDKKDAAVLALAQAHIVGPANNEWSAELIKARREFMEKGIPVSTIESALKQISSNIGNNPMRSTTAATAAAPGLPPLPSAPQATATANVAPNPARDEAVKLTAQAKLSLEKGDIAAARQFINQATALKVPEQDFASGQMRPWEVELAIRGRENLINNGVVQASATAPIINGVQNAGMNAAQANGVQAGVYQPQNDTSKVAPASGVLSSYDSPESGLELYQQGLSALSAGDKEAAVSKFKAAWQKKDELDAASLAQLKDKLTLLQSEPNSGAPEKVAALSAEDRELQVQRQRLFSEVTGEIADAERLAMANQPLEALEKLRNLRQRLASSESDSSYRKSLLTMVDRVSNNIDAWVEQNRVAIELDQRNRQIENRMQVEAAHEAKTDLQVQSLVDQYNDLIDSRRFPEAIEVAKRVAELKPGSEIATVMTEKAQIQARYEEYELIRGSKAEGFTRMMNNVDIAAIPADDNKPFMYPDADTWARITKNRLGTTDDGRMPASERRIREALTKPFSANFNQQPLSSVIDTIGEMFGIPVVIEDRSISEEGISRDQLVNLTLNGREIQLKSALNQILDSLNLTYVVKNEMLTIQSKRFTQRETYTKPYSVRDLVIPIPNFVTDYNSGMAGALQNAYQAQTSFASARIDPNTTAMTASIASMDPNSSVLSQIAATTPTNGLPASLASAMPGSSYMNGTNNAANIMGGGAMPNFGAIMQLIENTVTPDTWESAGGTANMFPFANNLSLVVTAPQETHEAIADLLKSLRTLQNLQVTIEVRFIQLQDTFYERIGVDFDMKYNDKARSLPNENSKPSLAVGLSGGMNNGVPAFTSDLDLTLGNNFETTPPFANASLTSATTFGVAILSDLELFFFLQAAQGNSRQNVLNAPKVTMFDGQWASINDTASRPFVISYDPVVGDFAVAQRPIVVVLNEGTQLSVQSVVSHDKRFVRMTLNPQFTRLEATDREFVFQGRKSTKSGTSILNPNGTPSGDRDDEEEIIEGTTVQQPTVGSTSIGTTVNVPDGGTILLGGIKRLREGRNERGAPILSKIPYLNRLFKNDAIGRETTTLMMTVTPRIIIPEEEEAALQGSIVNP